MKRLLPLLAVLGSLVAALIWYSGRDGEAVSDASAPTAQSGPEESPAADAMADLVAGPADLQEPATAKDGAEDSDRAALEEQDLAPAVETFPLAGRVKLDNVCATDEKFEVLAIKRAMTYGEFHRRDLLNSGERYILDRAIVGEDGTFQVDLPVDTVEAHLLVIGEYLYSESTWDGEVEGQATATTPVLHLNAGATVRGRLHAPSSTEGTEAADLEDITVILDPDLATFSTTRGAVIPMIRQKTQTAADGSFTFRGVPTGLKYYLHARPNKLAGFEMTVEGLAPCEARSLDISLTLGAALAGHVLDNTGEPVEGASVEARFPGRWFGMGGREMGRDTSDEDGYFQMKHVAPGKIQLHAEAEGYLESPGKTLDLIEGDRMTDLVVTLDSGGVLAGQVLWADGSPAADAQVEVKFDPAHLAGMGAFNAMRGFGGRDKADENGTFRVTGLGGGPFVVTATATAPLPANLDQPEKDPDTWKAHLEGVKPGSLELVLNLAEPRFLEGRVVDGAGEPVIVFHVSASSVADGPIGLPSQRAVTDDFEAESGAFALAGLVSGTWDVTVRAEGYGSVEVPAIDFPTQEGSEPLLFVLQEAAVAEGTVYGPTGETVAGAIVEVDTGEPAWMRLGSEGSGSPKATSAEDGTYRLENINPGAVTLYAHGKEYARGTPTIVDLSAGGVTKGVDLHLLEGGTLTGVIYRSDGEPAADRMITVTNMGSFDTSVSQSDRRGEFRFEHLDAGKVQIVAIDRGMDMAKLVGDGDGEPNIGGLLSNMKMTMVEIVDGEETHVVLGAPPADPVHVSGRVTHAGEPYFGATVTFYSGTGNLMERMRMCAVDKQGHYETVLDSPGFYMVAVQKIHGGPGQQTSVEFRRDIPAQEEVRLDFAIPEGRVSGRVLGPDGKPAGGARVTLTVDGPMKSGLMMGGQYSEITADENGHYDIPGLRPGTYSVSVGGMPMGGMFGGGAKFSRMTRSGVKLGEGMWLRDVDFRLEDPGAIEVTVLDEDRRPVAGASIFVRDDAGRLLERFSMSQTDTQGKFRYAGVSPGQYTVSARSVTAASLDSSELSVRTGMTVEASLSMQPGTLLLIALQDREGNSVDASISVIDSEGHDVNGMMGLSQMMEIYGEGGMGFSSHRVGPLPPGSYRVLAEDDQGRHANKPVRLSGQKERKITLRLK
jgi:protocatechuate 3,4-dioxygenase beta subunit